MWDLKRPFMGQITTAATYRELSPPKNQYFQIQNSYFIHENNKRNTYTCVYVYKSYFELEIV